MAIQQVFKLVLDSKDFGPKIDAMLKAWLNFSQTITAKEIDFKVGDDGVKDLSTKLAKAKKEIDNTVKSLEKSLNIKISDTNIIGSLKAARAKIQEQLAKSPVAVLLEVKSDLKALEGLTGSQLTSRKAAIKAKVAVAGKDIGVTFSRAFNSSASVEQQLKLVEGQLDKFQTSSSRAGKKVIALSDALKEIDKSSAKLTKSLGVVSSLEPKLKFFETLKPFSEGFVTRLEQFFRVLKEAESTGKAPKASVLKQFEQDFNQLALQQLKATQQTKDSVKEQTDIVAEGAAAQFRTKDRGGKAILETVKRVGFKITDEENKTFRPLGERVSDFSETAEAALQKTKELATQDFKVPESNPLSPKNLKETIALQEELNVKIQEFIKLQLNIKQLETDQAELAKKRDAGEIDLEQTGKLHNLSEEIAGRKKDALDLSAELTTLQDKSLAAEKAITLEQAKQLRLNAESKKIFTDIAAKSASRQDVIAAATPEVGALPSLPSANVVKDNFAKLQKLHEDSVKKEAEIQEAADNLRKAQLAGKSKDETTVLRKTLNDRLRELDRYNSSAETIARKLPEQLAKVERDAQKAFDNITKSARADVSTANKLELEARERTKKQEAIVTAKIESGATKEVVDLNRQLLEQLRTLQTIREQDAIAAQARLTKIEQEGTLQRVQAAGLDKKPTATTDTDVLEQEVASFEKQLPKVRELIQKRLDLERRGGELRLQLQRATTAEETGIIEVALEAQKKAVVSVSTAIAKARQEGFGGLDLKELISDTDRLVEQFGKLERAAQKEQEAQVKLAAGRDSLQRDLERRSSEREKTVQKLQTAAQDLPELPDTGALRKRLQDLEKLQEDHQRQSLASLEAFDELTRAKNRGSNAQIVNEKKDALKEIQDAESESQRAFERESKNLFGSINKLADQANKEFKRINQEATDDLTKARQQAQQARVRADDQEKVVRALKERKSSKEIIQLNEELLAGLESVATRREQDATRLQTRLAAIEKAGSLKTLQELEKVGTAVIQASERLRVLRSQSIDVGVRPAVVEEITQLRALLDELIARRDKLNAAPVTTDVDPTIAAELDAIRQQIQQVSQEAVALRSQVISPTADPAIRGKIEELETQLVQLKTKAEALRAAGIALPVDPATIEQLNTLQAEIAQVTNEITQLKSQIVDVSINPDAPTKVNELISLLGRLSAKEEELRSRGVGIEVDPRTVTDLQKIELEIDKLIAEIARVRDQVVATTIDPKTKQDLDGLQAKFTELTERLRVLKQEEARGFEAGFVDPAVRTEIEGLNAEIAQTAERITALKSQVVSANIDPQTATRLQELESLLNTLLQRSETLRSKLISIQVDPQAQTELQALDKQIAEVSKEIEKLNAETASVQVNPEAQEKIATLQRELDRLTEKLRSLSESSLTLQEGPIKDRVIAQTRELTAEITRVRGEIERLAAESVTIDVSQENKAKIQELQDLLATLQQRAAELRAAGVTLPVDPKDKAELDRLQQRVSELLFSLQTLSGTAVNFNVNQTVLAKIQELEAHLEQLRIKAEALRSETVNPQVSPQTLQDLKAIEAQIDTIEADIRELRALEIAIGANPASIEKLQQLEQLLIKLRAREQQLQGQTVSVGVSGETSQELEEVNRRIAETTGRIRVLNQQTIDGIVDPAARQEIEQLEQQVVELTQKYLALNKQASAPIDLSSIKDLQKISTDSTDKLQALVDEFAQQNPKLRELISRRIDIERRGNELSLQLTEAKTEEERKLVTAAQETQAKAVLQADRDLVEARENLKGDQLKTLTDETKQTVNVLADQQREIVRVVKKRQADEVSEERKKNREIRALGEDRKKEETALDAERRKRAKFEKENAATIAGEGNSQIVESARRLHKRLLELEEARLQRIRAIENEIVRVRNRGASSVVAGGGPPGGGGPPPEPPIVEKPTIAPFLAAVRQGQNEFDKLNTKASFFSDILKGFEKNLGQSIGSVIKFQLAWRITGSVITAATAPLLAIGDTLKKGFEFLIDLEEKATDLREVLLLNVKFSESLGENFEKAGEAAKFLVLQQQLLSGQIGVALDKFQSVFESFAASGGLIAVKTAGDDIEKTFTKANRSVALIITALNSVGISTRDTRRATENTNKLLEGRVKTADKIRIASGLTADELNRQSLEAQKVGKFAEFVERIFAAQAERINTSNQRFSTLLSQLRVFEARIGSLFVEPVFDKIVKFFQDLLKAIQDNDAAIKKFANNSITAFGRITESIGKLSSALTKLADLQFFQLFDILDRVNKGLQGIIQKFFSSGDPLEAGLFKSIIIGLSTVADFIGALSDLMSDFLKKVVANAKLVARDVRLAIQGPEGSSLFPKGPAAAVKEAAASPTSFALSTAARFASSRINALADQQAQDKKEIEQFEGLLRQKAALEKTHEENRTVERITLNQKRSKINKTSSEEEKKRLDQDLVTYKQFLEEEEKTRVDAVNKIKDQIARLQQNPAVQSSAIGSLFDNFNRNFDVAQEKTSKLLDDGISEIQNKLSDFIGNPRGGEGEGDKGSKFDNDRLNALNERLREQFELITQQTEIFIQRQKTLQEDRVQSEVVTTERISAKLEEQIEKLRRVTRDAIKESVTFKEADPRAIEKFANENNRRLLDIEGKARVQRERLRTETAKRLQALNDEAFKAELAKLREEAQQRAALTQELFNQGRLNQVEFIDEQIEQEKDLSVLLITEQRRRFDDVKENQEDALKVQNEILQSRIESVNRIAVLEKQQEEARRQLVAQRNALAIQDLELLRSRTQQTIELQEQGVITDQQRLENQVKLTAVSNALAIAQLREAERQLGVAKATKQTAEAIKAQEQAVESLRQAQLRAAVDQRIAERRATRSVGRRILEGLTGLDLTSGGAAREVIQEQIQQKTEAIVQIKDLKLNPKVEEEIIRDLEEQIQKLTVDFANLGESGLAKFVRGLNNAVSQIINSVNQVIQGFQQNGIVGGIGAGLTAAGGFFPEDSLPGQILKTAGAIVTGISSLFTALARRLAESIKKTFEKTLQAFQDQSITLGKAITDLEQQRLRAIEQLSGKKGGKKQLDELLPEFDRAIKDLVKQQQEIQDTFEDELGSLRLGNDALRDFSNEWDEVNKKVKEYVDSFRDGELTLEKQANAVEFLSRSLERLKEDLLDELADAEKEAISNALELNDLFKERLDLIKEMERAQEEFNRAQFELLTDDAIETRVAGAVRRGNDIIKLRRDFEEAQQERKDRLAELNLEISLKQKIFDKEKGIFSLTLNRTQLQQRNNVLEEQSLDRQIQKWKDIQGIIDGIQRNEDGTFSLSPNLQGQISPRITNVTIGAPQINIEVNTGGAPISPNQIIDPLTDFFSDKSRFGYQNS